MPWGVRGEDPVGGERQSPGKNVPGSVDIRMILVATPLTPEDRLVIAVSCGGVTAHVALLRGETRVCEHSRGTGGLCLLLDPLTEGPPAGCEDPPAQASLRMSLVRQEVSGLLRVRLRRRFVDHAFDVQLNRGRPLPQPWLSSPGLGKLPLPHSAPWRRSATRPAPGLLLYGEIPDEPGMGAVP